MKFLIRLIITTLMLLSVTGCETIKDIVAASEPQTSLFCRQFQTVDDLPLYWLLDEVDPDEEDKITVIRLWEEECLP